MAVRLPKIRGKLTMFRRAVAVFLLSAACLTTVAFADELTQIIQKDLMMLGYDPGNIQGELSTETIVAISKFQAENSLEINGEPSPQLAGIIKARMNAGNAPGQAAPAMAARPDPAALQAAQQACLQEKIAAAQSKKKKKRGFGSLMKAVTNTAVRYGGGGIAGDIAETSRDIYNADATAKDWNRAAKDLGLQTSDIEECQNPSM